MKLEKVRYMISDASNFVNVEAHVLRYWEEELGLEIPRNELGHRYYTRENIQEFLRIKDLKEKGYQLRAIKDILRGETVDKPSINGTSKTPEARMEEFKELMTGIVGAAIALNNEELSLAISNEVEQKILKEFNYLMREQETLAEERYQKLDSAIRGSVKKAPLFFKRKPIHITE